MHSELGVLAYAGLGRVLLEAALVAEGVVIVHPAERHWLHAELGFNDDARSEAPVQSGVPE
eukprot:14832554-Alexandrium_andersonii.AAC.1